MSDEEKAPRIVVRDRRAFTSDGSRREGVEPRPPGPAPEPLRQKPPPRKPSASTLSGGAQTSRPPEDPRFKQLVSLLFSQAAMLLEKPPETGDAAGASRAEALQGLQTVIGLVETLEEKTRGRLAPGDRRLVSQVLYQLRLAYMERAKAPGG